MVRLKNRSFNCS